MQGVASSDLLPAAEPTCPCASVRLPLAVLGRAVLLVS